MINNPVKLNKTILALVVITNGVVYSQDVRFDPKPYSSAIIVNDVDSSLVWYQSVLELRVRNRTDTPERGSKIVVLESPLLLIELIEVKSSLSQKKVLESYAERTYIEGFSKIGFKVSNLDESINRLRNLNVLFFGDVFTDPFSKKRSFLLVDPDGNLIQFFE